MAERRALGGEAHVTPAEVPAIAWDGPVELPPSAPVLVRTGHELSMRIPCGKARGPHGLGLRADEAVGAVAFQLPTVTGVDEPVVLPALTREDQRLGG